MRAQSESERAARLHTLSSIVGHVLCRAAHEVHAYGGRGSAGICTRECRRARDRSCALGAIGAIGAIRATSADQHRHEQTSPSHARQLAQSRGELQALSTFSKHFRALARPSRVALPIGSAVCCARNGCAMRGARLAWARPLSSWMASKSWALAIPQRSSNHGNVSARRSKVES